MCREIIITNLKYVANQVIIGDFRFEYEIEYENDFSMSYPLNPTLSTNRKSEGSGNDWFEI